MTQVFQRDGYNEMRLYVAFCRCDLVSEQTAIELGLRYVERYPESFEGWKHLASVYRHYRGDDEKALAAAEQARRLRPLDPGILIMIRDLQRALDKPVDRTLTSLAYQKDLVVYSHRAFAYMATIRRQISASIGANFQGADRDRFERIVTLYFTADAFDQRFRPRLDDLDWSAERWRDVATLYADSANIVAGVSDADLTALRREYSQPNNVAVMRELYAIRDAVADEMVSDFIEELNRGGS